MLKVRWLDADNSTREENLPSREITVRGTLLFFLDNRGGILLIIPQERLVDVWEAAA